MKMEGKRTEKKGNRNVSGEVKSRDERRFGKR